MNDNQLVEAGAVLVEIDPRDYQVAVDKAKAELADAEAAAIAAQSNVPITSTSTESSVSSAQSGVEQAREPHRCGRQGDRGRTRAARRRAVAAARSGSQRHAQPP